MGAAIHHQRRPGAGQYDLWHHEGPRVGQAGREPSAGARRDQQIGGLATIEPARGETDRAKPDHANLDPVTAETGPRGRGKTAEAKLPGEAARFEVRRGENEEPAHRLPAPGSTRAVSASSLRLRQAAYEFPAAVSRPVNLIVRMREYAIVTGPAPSAPKI